MNSYTKVTDKASYQIAKDQGYQWLERVLEVGIKKDDNFEYKACSLEYAIQHWNDAGIQILPLLDSLDLFGERKDYFPPYLTKH